jgi:hypothetical protein
MIKLIVTNQNIVSVPIVSVPCIVLEICKNRDIIKIDYFMNPSLKTVHRNELLHDSDNKCLLELLETLLKKDEDLLKPISKCFRDDWLKNLIKHQNYDVVQKLWTLKKNKGTGAGGSNTNLYGKKFEEITDNRPRLINAGFTIQDLYLSKQFSDKIVWFLPQNSLKQYIAKKYNIQLFRCPDEGYLVEYHSGRKVLLILEKKEQNVEGSVETKLWSGPSLKREYQIVMGNPFEVVYGFCVNRFLQQKLSSNEEKYIVLNKILKEHNIDILFGNDDNYFESLDKWISASNSS